LIKIIHIFPRITIGGGTSSPLNVVRHLPKNQYKHIFISLASADPKIFNDFTDLGFSVINNPSVEDLNTILYQADIVHCNWWNTPEMSALFLRALPPCRLLLWLHVTGDTPPHILTKELIGFTDHLCVCTPYSLENQLVMNHNKVSFIHSPADFNRLKDYKKRKHKGFNIGYVGTIDYAKMHNNYLDMCKGLSIPDAIFLVCGTGRSLRDLKNNAIKYGMEDRFRFFGHIENIAEVFSQMDIYGYPLNENTFAASELNLQEAMWAGLPIVTNPYGGVRHLIEHNETGLLVESEEEYIDAIEYLYEHPEERERLGKNAAVHARKHFTPVISADKFEHIYKRMLESPKVEKEPIYTLSTDRRFEGTLLLIKSIGDSAKALSFSMESQNPFEALNADKEIAMSDDLFHQGCIIQFLHAYPTDPWLNFWNGLIEFERKNIGEAYDSWSQAVKYDINCERIFYYLGLAAECEADEEIRSKLLDLRLTLDSKISPDQQSTSSVWKKLQYISKLRIRREIKNDLTRILKSKPRIMSPELSLPQQIEKALEKAFERPIFLWGAGVTGQKVKTAMDPLGLLPQGFIDQAREIDSQVLELPVSAPEILDTIKSAFVLICTMQYRQVAKSLEQLGLKPIEDFLAIHIS